MSLMQLVDELEKLTVDLRFHTGHKQRSDLILNKSPVLFNPSSITDHLHFMDLSPFILLLLTFVFRLYVTMIAADAWGNKLLFPLHFLSLAPQVESRKRLAKTVLVFVGLFAVCWLPSHVIYLYRSYHYSQVDNKHFSLILIQSVLICFDQFEYTAV